MGDAVSCAQESRPVVAHLFRFAVSRKPQRMCVCFFLFWAKTVKVIDTTLVILMSGWRLGRKQ